MELIPIMKYLWDMGLGERLLEVGITLFFVFCLLGLFFWAVRKPLIRLGMAIYKALVAVPQMQSAMDRMNDTVERLSDTLQEHMVQTDLRMSAGDEKFQVFEREITTIKSQISDLTRRELHGKSIRPESIGRENQI